MSSVLLKHSALYAIGNIANKVAGFIMLPLYTFHLTTHDYGLIEYADYLVMIFAILFGLHALGSAQIRIYHEQKSGDTDAVISTSLFTALITSGVIATIGVLLSKSIAVWILHSEQYQSVISLSFITIIFVTNIELLLIHKRLKQQALFFVIFSLIRLIFSICLNVYLIAFKEMGIMGFVYSNLITSSLFSIYLLLDYLFHHKIKVQWQVAKDIIRFGYPLVFASLSMFVIHFSDRFILGHFHTMEDVGLYALAYKFAFLVSVLVGEPFNRVWDVNVFEYAENKDWKTYFSKVFVFYSIALFAVVIGISLFVDNLLGWIIDPKFSPALVLIPVLLIGYAIREQGDFFKQILYINKQSHLVGKVSTISAAINLLISFLLIPTYGTMGAAFSTLITWIVYSAMLWFLQHREFHIQYHYRSIGLVLLLTLTAIYIPSIYPASSVLINGVYDVMVIAILVILLFVFRIITIEDQQFLKNKLFGSR